MIKKFFGVVILLMIALTQNAFAEPRISYQVHVQDYGWMPPVSEGRVAGTTGENRRIEAIIINCPEGIEYNAHIQDYGWEGWMDSGVVAGTVGEGRRLEAIRIRLTGSIANSYDVYYRAHVENFGWQDWVSNGRIAGTEGRGLRMEAIQIRLVKKGDDRNNFRHRRGGYRHGYEDYS